MAWPKPKPEGQAAHTRLSAQAACGRLADEAPAQARPGEDQGGSGVDVGTG